MRDFIIYIFCFIRNGLDLLIARVLVTKKNTRIKINRNPSISTFCVCHFNVCDGSSQQVNSLFLIGIIYKLIDFCGQFLTIQMTTSIDWYIWPKVVLMWLNTALFRTCCLRTKSQIVFSLSIKSNKKEENRKHTIVKSNQT